ncbi:MAG TPA: molybdopterin-dependent oxidoreductase [Fimbriimonadaceae bacterium]|nr:molybdopterin-dependent oxidoreductase [Fimbriimonadaceae bacterium]HRJ95272.1 molybdopterin-dependent oxidoreductase [Fimbriimonadaceae bacterium]
MSRDPDFEQEVRRVSRRSFLWGGLALGGAVGVWQAILRSPRSDGMLAPLRAVNGFNGALWQRMFREGAQAPTFEPSLAGARFNGDIGLRSPLNLADWRLRLEGLPGGERLLTLDDLLALPRTEQTTELMCVEGWSQIMTFAGVRMTDLLDALGSPTIPPFVGMETPDGRYQVALDAASALHPQTLLAYEMNGRPLEPRHGAPLRLAMPVKYGFKQIKRIGRIRFTERPPLDYWHARGYDWFAGL